MLNMDEIERLARAAKQDSDGKWEWRDDYGETRLVRGGKDVAFAAPCAESNSYIVIEPVDAAYIAALSPDVALALVAKVRELEAQVEKAEMVVRYIEVSRTVDALERYTNQYNAANLREYLAAYRKARGTGTQGGG